MRKKLTFLVLGLCITLAQAQVCPKLIGPLDGDTDVSVTTDISWENLTGGQIFLISLGSTPGGADIIDRRTSGIFATFTPPKGLPERTRIYVSLQVIDSDLGSFNCELGSFFTEDVTTAPSCTTIRDPLNDAVFVREEVNIVWNYAPLATGYRLSMGTSPGGSEIVNNLDVGNSLFYDPSIDLPVNAIVYVRLIPYNENGSAPNSCAEESFATRIVSSNLECTQLTYPLNGANEIPETLAIKWQAVAGATGYKVSLGSSPLVDDIFYTAFVNTNTTSQLNLEASRRYWVAIVPYNDAGEALGCTAESFTTRIDCSPFIDEVTGETVISKPAITLPSQISICNIELPYRLNVTDPADGYRWFKRMADGTTVLLSETDEVQIEEGGNYLFEAYNTVTILDRLIDCENTKEITVDVDNGPTILSAIATNESGNLTLVVEVEGSGRYEFSLDGPDGPYQDHNIFENQPNRLHTVYVRDKDACGVAKRLVEFEVSPEGFPKFFTPNGDGINDYWQFRRSSESRKAKLGPIAIFDRYGAFLLQIGAQSEGWDGTLNGRPLPASDYWFTVFVEDGKQFKGHFALKR